MTRCVVLAGGLVRGRLENEETPGGEMNGRFTMATVRMMNEWMGGLRRGESDKRR